MCGRDNLSFFFFFALYLILGGKLGICGIGVARIFNWGG